MTASNENLQLLEDWAEEHDDVPVLCALRILGKTPRDPGWWYLATLFTSQFDRDVILDDMRALETLRDEQEARYQGWRE